MHEEFVIGSIINAVTVHVHRLPSKSHQNGLHAAKDYIFIGHVAQLWQRNHVSWTILRGWVTLRSNFRLKNTLRANIYGP